MAGEIAYNVYDNHIVRTGGAELYHKPPSAHTHRWDHQWNAAGYDTITFTGTRIRIYAVTYSQYGIATVSVDGGAATDVDLYTPTSVACTVPVWDSGVLVSEEHTVVWSWSGRKNAAATTATFTAVLDWIDITPPPNANPIDTGDFGVMTGRTSAVTGGYAAQVRYAIDARNYIDFLVDTPNTGDSTVAIELMLDGVATVGGDTTWMAPYLVTLPAGLAQAYIKVVAREAGNYKLFEVWVAPSATPTAWVLYLSLPLFALMGTHEWSNPYSLGAGYEWTDVAAADAVVPSPPTTAWYTKNFETSLDGAYGRVTMLGTDGLPTTVYSNGADGNDSLVAVNTTEYFDPTSTLAQVNSCQFSIHTPFTKETPQTTIAAFLATFAQDQPFEVERGWMTTTDGDEDYDVVTMGRFFVTDATLDKNQWIVNVEAQDGMGLLLDARYLNSPYGVIAGLAPDDGLLVGPYADEDYIPLPSGDDYVSLVSPVMMKRLWIDDVLVCEMELDYSWQHPIVVVDAATGSGWGYTEIYPGSRVGPYDAPLSSSTYATVNGVSPRSDQPMQVNHATTGSGTGCQFFMDSADVTLWFHSGTDEFIDIQMMTNYERVGGCYFIDENDPSFYAYMDGGPEATNLPVLTEGWHSMRYAYEVSA